MTTAKPVKRPRGEGQWALGYREPLNPNEQFKKDDDALNVRARIVDIYSKQGFDSIDKQDLRGRMRWMGLYTQREQGYDGTWTGDENADVLEAKYFMMRVRCDGGALSNGRAAHARRDLHRVRPRHRRHLRPRERPVPLDPIEDVPEIWERLAAVGLQTTEACGDCPRVVLGSPLAGESLDEVLDPTWAVDEIVRRYIGNPEFSNLPAQVQDRDLGPAGRRPRGQRRRVHRRQPPRARPGSRRVGRRRPVDQPDAGPAARRLGAAGRGARRLGGRDVGVPRLRLPAAAGSKARLKFLIKDWGIEKFRQVLETEYLRRKLIDGPAPEPVKHPIDHVGIQKLKNGKNAVGVAPIAGRVSGTILTKVADLAEAAGSDRIRFTPYQKLIILDVPDDKLDELVAGLDALGLPSTPSHWRKNLMACTGIEYCKLSFAETRGRAQVLVPELEKRLEDINAQLDVPITVNINGCPNSCARIQVADIGFKGQMVDDGDGGSVEGFQVHLGGSLGLDSGFGRKLRQHKVLSTELGDYIDRVVRNFVKQREQGERFATWAVRADEADLR